MLLLGRSDLEPALRDLGARSVHVHDFDDGEIEVRDGAFDLAIIPDLSAIQNPTAAIRRLRRVVDGQGAVVAMGRADTGNDVDEDAFPALGPARITYAELYDLFALQFETVVMSGVLAFEGIVFAELGADEDVSVSVDARLAPPAAPGVFVVVASRDPRELDPYAIVQVPEGDSPVTETEAEVVKEREIVAAFAAVQLQAELLAAQLDDSRRKIVALETRVLERDDQMAALLGELDALRRTGADLVSPDPEILAQLIVRAERSESSLVIISEGHASEMAGVEMQLQERAQVLAATEKELLRREKLVKELVSELEEARAGNGGIVFQSVPPNTTDPDEVVRLRRKIDELALEIARRDGELLAQHWRLQEIEHTTKGPSTAPDASAKELDGVRHELDALRQALTQEHAARIAAESAIEELRGPA